MLLSAFNPCNSSDLQFIFKTSVASELIYTFFSLFMMVSDANITPCEMKRRDSIHYSQKFVPFCKPDGSWSEIQCELSSGSCWCVDSEGHEIIGSRSTSLKSCPNFG